MLRPATTKEAALPALTISRQMGSLGDEIAAALADRLGWDLIDRNDAIDRFLGDASPADRHLLRESSKHYLALSPSGLTFLESIEQNLRAFLASHPAVLVGFGTRCLLAGDRDVVHVRVVASRAARAARVRQRYRVSAEEAERLLDASDRRQRRFAAAVYGEELSDPAGFDLTLGTTRLSVEEGVAAVLSVLEKRRARVAAETELPLEALVRAANGGRGAPTPAAVSPEDASPFKHPSEAEFARILDMYGIEWTYEPRTFPLEWDDQGRVVQAFSPDFHLTRFGTYIELTTMDQRHVTEKNRKLKRLRELYPDIDVRIVYRKDFRSLLERFRAAGTR